MNIKSQLTSFELSKRLKELEVKQDSYFVWFTLKEIDCYSLSESWQIDDRDRDRFDFISAFTVAELLELLPHRITLLEGEPYNSFRFRMAKGIWCLGINGIKFTKFYSVNYYCDSTSQDLDWMVNTLTKNISEENPANALALMLIYLYENGLIKND